MRGRGLKTRGLALGVVLVAAMAAGELRASTGPFHLRDGVIVDPERGTALAGAPDGAIEAIELASGRVLWRSTAGTLPLGLHANLLAAQAEEPVPGARLRLVVLNVADAGRKVIESVAELPPGARALVTGEHGKTFRATATYDGCGFEVSWTYRERLVEGVAPEPGQLPPERKLSGTTHLCARAHSGSSRVAPACASVDALRLAKEHALPAAPWRTGNVLAAAIGGSGEALILRRWNACTGKSLPDRTLSKRAVTALRSADGRHLLVVERVGAGGAGDPEYLWTVVSLETGDALGALRRDASAAPFFVWKDRIVFESRPHGFRRDGEWIEVPLELVAVRIGTGEPLWRRRVRDLEYRGPAPPAPPGAW